MRAATPATKYVGSGMGVDAQGGPVVDPTENVIALNEASHKRQDDLRDLNDRRIDESIKHVHEMAELREQHAQAITSLESNRLNAIRQVDVLAVSTAADRAQAAIQALATVTAANAENLRNALTATAATIASQLATTVAQIVERIGALEKSSYEGKGKQAVADPMIAELVTEMKSLRESRAGLSGKSEGISTSWVVMLGAVGLLVTLLSLGVFTRTAPVVPAPTPQVIYVPSPPGTMLPSTPPQPVPR